MSLKKKPLVLLILDGWGYREDTSFNAIHTANTPVLDDLTARYPNTLISGSGMDVGLPHGQMGNSEVGHINLGSGRIVYQDFTRISKAILDGDFFKNDVLINNLNAAISNDNAVHIMGLLSPGGVHSHLDHILGMIKMAHQQGAKQIYFHGFLDGRDTPPRSAAESIKAVDELFAELGTGKTATIIGRYYAMDRDQRWDRIETAWDMLTRGEAPFTADNALAGLEAAYQRDENDEFVQATIIGDAAPIQDGDAVFFMNFRADRAREITRAFVDTDFTGFDRKQRPELAGFVMLTEYADDIDTDVAFPKEPLVNVMGDWLAQHNKTQLRISETEKYAHVTFFFNGGQEQAFSGEDRELIPSPKVATYDLQPEMNSTLLTDKLVAAIESQQYDTIICNYPNGDMVGHTGVFDAAVKACEAVDSCIGRVVKALQHVGGECLITADHGNAEQMVDTSTEQAHTAHTSEPVPLIYVGRDASFIDNHEYKLSDIAPTMLSLMNMDIPPEMTGQSLLKLQ